MGACAARAVRRWPDRRMGLRRCPSRQPIRRNSSGAIGLIETMPKPFLPPGPPWCGRDRRPCPRHFWDPVDPRRTARRRPASPRTRAHSPLHGPPADPGQGPRRRPAPGSPIMTTAAATSRRISAIQGPLDFIEPALLVLGKCHGSSLSREPTAAMPPTHPRLGNVNPVEIGHPVVRAVPASRVNGTPGSGRRLDGDLRTNTPQSWWRGRAQE